jgi:hypothetical protein
MINIKIHIVSDNRLLFPYFLAYIDRWEKVIIEQMSFEVSLSNA